MAKKYVVTLTEEERGQLQDIVDRGKQSAEKRKRAQALLMADEGQTDQKTAEQCRLSVRGIEELRKRFVEEGFETTLAGKTRGHRARKIQGEDEAHLIALTCGEKPEGRARWTLRLLKDRFVLSNGEPVSIETIRQTLKKTT